MIGQAGDETPRPNDEKDDAEDERESPRIHDPTPRYI
jgi:hypothetical protein